jgi:hypothetical protein
MGPPVRSTSQQLAFGAIASVMLTGRNARLIQLPTNEKFAEK